MRIEVEDGPRSHDLARIRGGLARFNLRYAPPDNYRPLVVCARAEDGTVSGGLIGETFWEWLHVSFLWVDEPVRGQGIGAQLLHRAEAEAVSRGCRGVFLDTLSFQAPQFYLKHGYVEWGRIDDLPRGHTRIFLRKDLGPTPAPSDRRLDD